jgi:hypothetical protein
MERSGAIEFVGAGNIELAEDLAESRVADLYPQLSAEVAR